MSKKIDRTAAKASVDHIKRLSADNGGKVPVWAVQAAAKKLGVKERAVWRWLKHGVPQGESHALTQGDERRILEALAAANGQQRVAWSSMVDDGSYEKSYSQFNRDVAKIDPIARTGVTQGIKAALAKGLYLQGTSTGRLDRVLFDHTEADVRLQRSVAGKLEMFRPWVTLLLDSHTRMILAWFVTEGDGMRGDPGTESLVALLAAAIRGSEASDGTFIGGVPAVVQFDNAKAHLADAMVNGYLELGIATHAIKPGSPWEDGRVERLMRTFRDEFLAKLPGYTKALADRYNHEPWRPEDCMGIQEFTLRLQQWVDHYNFERHHAALGSTPFEAWKSDPTPINRADDDLVRRGFMAEASGRKVSKNGVRFKEIDYVHPKLGTLVGKRVTIRFLPNDRTFIDLYCDDQFICTAIPHNRLSVEQRAQIVRERNNQIAKANHLVKRTRARAEQRMLEGNPLLSPEHDPLTPARKIDDPSDEEFLDFLEVHTNTDSEPEGMNDHGDAA